MTIEWNKVTRFSQVAAIVLGLLIFGTGYWLGMQAPEQGPVPEKTGGVISDVTYACEGGGQIHALFYDEMVTITLSDGRTYNLPHVISGSGARYANEDESRVFWEKGAAVTYTEGNEDGGQDVASCTEVAVPQ